MSLLAYFELKKRPLIEEAIKLVPEKVFWTWLKCPIISTDIYKCGVGGEVDTSHIENDDSVDGIATDLTLAFIDGYLAGKGIK